MSRIVNINGVSIDVDNIKDVKSLKDVQKLDLFSHMNDSAKKGSEEDLLDAINSKGKFSVEQPVDQRNVGTTNVIGLTNQAFSAGSDAPTQTAPKK